MTDVCGLNKNETNLLYFLLWEPSERKGLYIVIYKSKLYLLTNNDKGNVVFQKATKFSNITLFNYRF